MRTPRAAPLVGQQVGATGATGPWKVLIHGALWLLTFASSNAKSQQVTLGEKPHLVEWLNPPNIQLYFYPRLFFPLKWPSPLLSQCALRPQTSILKPSLDRACYTLVTTALEGFISWVDTGHIQQPDHLGSPLATILTLFSYTISLLVLTLPFLP